MVYIKCKNCGTEFEGNFCPNCGAPARIYEPQNQIPMPSARPARPKKKHGCLTAIIALFSIVFIVFIIAMIKPSDSDSNSDSNEASTKAAKTEFQEVTGTSPEEETSIMEILKKCGLTKINSITHDEILDDMSADGETGYRISSGDVSNIILYLGTDKTVNVVRYADNSLYADGEIKSVITDYIVTWDEASDLQIRCQKVLKDYILKSPSTAKFPSLSKWNMWKQDGKIYIQSYVDAQNSFGAELRSDFQFTLSADDYTVESLIFDGEEMMQ